MIGYRHLFIFKYPSLTKIDNEEITEVDRDISRKFTMENKEEYVNANIIRPNTSKTVSQLRELTNTFRPNDNDNISSVKVKDKVITSIEYCGPKKVIVIFKR